MVANKLNTGISIVIMGLLLNHTEKSFGVKLPLWTQSRKIASLSRREAGIKEQRKEEAAEMNPHLRRLAG